MIVIALTAAIVVVCQPENPPGDPGGGEETCSIIGLVDSDSDGIPDRDEGMDEEDSDGDGTPDARDLDSDDDGRPDAEESGLEDCEGELADSDDDGTPDFQDSDSDNNGVIDGDDSDDDIDGDDLPNWRDPDDDGDGVADVIEIGPDPADPADSDGDGVPDFHDSDSDNDTIPDVIDGGDDADGDGLVNLRDTDSDEDGIPDSTEAGVDPGLPPVDSDGDGTADYLDSDSDNDGLFDYQELELGTSPTERDTDGDRYSDARELECGTDPLDGTMYPTEGPCVADGCGPMELCGDDGTGDGTDNDCNGLVDEGCVCLAPGQTKACYRGVPANRGHGICTDGVQICTEFLTWGECDGGSGPEPEVCDDGIDQSCSGADEDCCIPYPECVCVPGAVRYCDEPGYCYWGTQVCRDDGLGWGTCTEISPPAGCETHHIYNVECCISIGGCCQDFWDIDGDGDNMESMGDCSDIACPTCNCDPGEIRYCEHGYMQAWGVQECVEDSMGWNWGICEAATAPETCGAHTLYDMGGQQCCAESGYCCQDAADLDHDWDRGESMGNCDEPECCM